MTALAAVLVYVPADMAAAQTTPTTTGGHEAEQERVADIVVTARKREESLQSASLSVSAF